MNNNTNKVLSTIGFWLFAVFSSFAGDENRALSQFSQWTDISTPGLFSSAPGKSRQLKVDIVPLRQLLLTGQEDIVITLPLPDGLQADFRLTPSRVAAPGLLEKYPAIRTFSGYQLDKPANHGRFDISPRGFYGMFRYEGVTVYIDPQRTNGPGGDEVYASYSHKNRQLPVAGLMPRFSPKKEPGQTNEKLAFLNRENQLRQAQTRMRSYRLAISATGEYTQYHGGTKELALAAIVTLVNRLNVVYQRDLAISLELVADNDAIIYTDAASDPFANDSFDGGLNTAVINEAIGSDNYDIGHVVNTDGGGLAGYGVVCNDSRKGDGITGSPSPEGDAFYIDFVAHEIGHQFRADHTFNGLAGSCDDNREADAAYEPGSASTIMGYAGICTNQNLQSNSDAYFHTHSISQISAFIISGFGSNCGSDQVLANNDPVADAGADYSIPAQTPFILKGSASDEDSGDSLSYSWEQYDLGSASSNVNQMVDDGQRPLFRAWSPVSDSSRTFPRLTDILDGETTIGETYATTTRELNFRLVVRDDNGGVSTDSMTVNVIDTAEAFAVTEPGVSSQWSTSIQQVSWNPASTSQAPISCDAVNIDLSVDGGTSFFTTLLENTANDGSAEVVVPNLSSNQARVRISCVDNIFFAISAGDFSLEISDSVEELIIVGQQTLTMAEDGNITLSTAHFTYGGLSADSIRVLDGENYSVEGNKVLPDADYSGELSVAVIASRGNIDSETFSATISVTEVNDAPDGNDDSFTVNEDSSANALDVLANDTDSDSGDSLSLDSFVYSGSGSVSIVDNKLSYSPVADFTGTDSLTYTLSDSTGAQASANVTISVSAASGGGGGSSGGAAAWLLFLLALLNLRSLRAGAE
ncbi:reprolysin-like metallopeptidase [Thalassomonas actiniarum]|uniref:Cadherin-like domain-containing protein n=1 Tax=Thalassomonas actiniarum TaxID=485447 RepID=A0AAE9YPS7_9GAMM|nr:zinc-dependent metalloprotease family protein [Thalassomonas actiniarum]WDD98039.1 cadherin-like domain-containing protein [Thalassomonas actiniarum]